MRNDYSSKISLKKRFKAANTDYKIIAEKENFHYTSYNTIALKFQHSDLLQSFIV